MNTFYGDTLKLSIHTVLYSASSVSLPNRFYKESMSVRLTYLEVLFGNEWHFLRPLPKTETGPVPLVSKDGPVAYDLGNVILAWPRLVDIGPRPMIGAV